MDQQDVVPGVSLPSTSWFNGLKRRIARRADVDLAAPLQWQAAGRKRLLRFSWPRAIDIRLKGGGSGGVYPFEEMQPKAGGGWTLLPGGRTGANAVEYNGLTNLPAGAVVPARVGWTSDVRFDYVRLGGSTGPPPCGARLCVTADGYCRDTANFTVTVSGHGFSGSCTAQFAPLGGLCCFNLPVQGTYTVVISSPNYVSQTLTPALGCIDNFIRVTLDRTVSGIPPDSLLSGCCSCLPPPASRQPYAIKKRLYVTLHGPAEVFGSYDGVSIPLDWDPTSSDGSGTGPMIWDSGCLAGNGSYAICAQQDGCPLPGGPHGDDCGQAFPESWPIEVSQHAFHGARVWLYQYRGSNCSNICSSYLVYANYFGGDCTNTSTPIGGPPGNIPTCPAGQFLMWRVYCAHDCPCGAGDPLATHIHTQISEWGAQANGFGSSSADGGQGSCNTVPIVLNNPPPCGFGPPGVDPRANTADGGSICGPTDISFSGAIVTGTTTGLSVLPIYLTTFTGHLSE